MCCPKIRAYSYVLYIALVVVTIFLLDNHGVGATIVLICIL